MLLTNGRIYTLDPAHRVVDTLVVRDGRVAFAGRRADVNVPGAEPVVDVGGRAVLPGLADAHAHLMHLARARLSVSLGGAGSEEAAAGRVAAAAARLAPGDWIGGRGWDQNRWPGGRFPDKTGSTARRPATRSPSAGSTATRSGSARRRSPPPASPATPPTRRGAASPRGPTASRPAS